MYDNENYFEKLPYERGKLEYFFGRVNLDVIRNQIIYL